MSPTVMVNGRSNLNSPNRPWILSVPLIIGISVKMTATTSPNLENYSG